jgi:hypothetical protein
VIGVACLAVVLWRTLARSELARTATSNSTYHSQAALPAGAAHCQPAAIPAGTAAVSFGARGQSVRISVGGVSASAAIAPGAQFGFARLPVTTKRDHPDATVCLTNTGAAPLVLLGDYGDALHRGPFVARIDWFRSAPQRRWSLGPTVARRLPLAKSSLLGEWTLWVALAAIAALSIVAIWWSATERRA